MKKLSIDKKKKIVCGSPAMVAWVSIIGVSLALSVINTFVSNITSVNNSNYTYSKANYSNKKSTMIRMSAMPSRSAINFWV